MEKEPIAVSSQPDYLKVPAKIVSYIFHPLFLPTYIFLWLVLRFPFEFPGITPMQLFLRKITVFWMTAFFPAFSVFLLWRLKFIESVFLKSQKERIIPYIITMFFYWWLWYLSRNFIDQPVALKIFFFGIFMVTIAGLIFNTFFKISMHAMGVGGLLAFVLLATFYYHIYLGADLAITTLITGLVCTARLLISDHTNFELYAGFFAGITCQLIAFWIYT